MAHIGFRCIIRPDGTRFQDLEARSDRLTQILEGSERLSVI